MKKTAAIGVWLLLVAVGCKGDSKKSEKKPEQAEKVAAEKEAEVAIERPPLPKDADAPFALSEQTKEIVLDNGLRVFIRKNSKPEKRAQLWLVVNAGSVHEDDNQRGLAHFLEHMAFNGTKSFPKNELISALQKMGAQFGAHINAYTSFDETVYKLEVPTDEAEGIATGIKILREWSSDITINPKDVDEERGVVLSEKRNSEGVQMRITEKLISELFAGTRYAERLPIGKPEILKKAPASELRRFYEDWYHPGNMAVIAVGDFDPADMEKRLRESFSNLAKKDGPRPQVERKRPARDKWNFLTMRDKELPVAMVAFGHFRDPPTNISMNDFRRSYIENSVFTMLAARLEEARKRGNGKYMGAAVVAAPLVRAANALLGFAAVKPEEMQAGFENLLTEIERARRHGFTESEYERAKKQLLASLESTAREEAAGKESSQSLTEELVRHVLTGEGAPGRAMELAVFEHFAKEVKLEELKPLLEGLMSAKDLTFVSLGPPGAKLAGEAEMVSLFKSLPSKQIAPYSDEKSDVPLIAKAPTPGTITAEKKYDAIGAVEWTLSNGARIILKPTKFKKDEVVFQAVSPGGFSLLSMNAVRRGVFAAEVVPLGGYGDLDAIDLEKGLAGRQVSVSPFIGNVREGVRATSAAEDVETMLQLVHLVFTQPRKDAKAFAVWKDAKKTEVELAGNTPTERFMRRMLEFINQNSKRFHRVDSVKEVNALDLMQSFEIFRDRLQDADDFTFVMVGAFEVETIKPLLLRYLGSLEKIDRKEATKPSPFSPSKAERLVVRDGDVDRADLRLFFLKEVDAAKVATDHKARHALEVFARAVTMRLIELLREEMGDTYSASAFSQFPEFFSVAQFGVVFSVAADRADKLETVALEEVAKLVASGVSEEHFKKARKAAVKALETQLESNQVWASSFAEASLAGWSPTYITKQKRLLEELTLADVTAAAQRFIDVDKAQIAVHLPKK